ncbi:hypothetical protein H8784_06300 [Parabacteroides acidifaciens]|jgi:hypothetical protein|uniref:Uncharacterized protein n=1 Tax=Parabacteroides acidifaciens TaxID=2290935 RepID=A0A3D8HGI5_9BACT|nr:MULTISPECIES: DUF6722 family protein [Parabacteroides]MBC8601331.1 hypothetical protein [Parabacteroides acidifaciens]RDU50011.1 hypothetical protein DWU89_06450 [Parabacteroides acidifaciens]RHR52588.1 hypothetical protein DWW90_17325 [Parabacteroides sp. AF17-28]
MEIKERVGIFVLDISKLIFGGVILSSIVSENINPAVVYGLGFFFFMFGIAIGFVLIDNTDKKGDCI